METLPAVVISGLLTAVLGVLGWIASSLSALRSDVSRLVKKEDCNRAMDAHCSRLEIIEKQLRHVQDDVATLKGKIL